MRILIITQIYRPEMGALSNRLYPIVRTLVDKGHKVAVATGMPNYPAGRVFAEYRGKIFSKEVKDGHRILRTNYFTAPRNKSKLTQLLSYLTFMPAVFYSGIRAGKCDVVLITSPPIFPVIPAIILAKIRGAKLVFDIRDLWSDELVTFGGISENSISVKIARKLENWGYRIADMVSATTNSLMSTVIDRGARSDSTIYFPNGADLELFRPLPKSGAIERKYQFGDRFVVMYSGLFGIKHGLETLLEAANILRDREDIVFFLLGNGARREQLEKYIEEKALDNVIIRGEIDIEEVPKVISISDVCFAAFKPEPYAGKLISVKIFEYLACEKPVVGSFEGESAKVIEESKGGIVVAPGDSQAIADAILLLQKDPARRKAMGIAGRQFVEASFSRSKWAGVFERALADLFKQSFKASIARENENVGTEA
ncbi:MAG: glycosyltransferase family 4 protein [Pyrinomonadaceae bacterium]|nr:glycosyltransferase family 4 protein [Pyrinomonadaceae bacterium]